jgi:hypothetical protein
VEDLLASFGVSLRARNRSAKTSQLPVPQPQTAKNVTGWGCKTRPTDFWRSAGTETPWTRKRHHRHRLRTALVYFAVRADDARRTTFADGSPNPVTNASVRRRSGATTRRYLDSDNSTNSV